MTYVFAPEHERFSLDDPEAGRKLVENLDRRKVRLAFSELCWHFDADGYDERARLRVLLEALKVDGVLVEPEQKLFCRPALAHGQSGTNRRKAIAQVKRLARRMKDTSARDGQAAAILAFIGTRGQATVASMKDEAARLGFPDGRINYLIQHMRETSRIEKVAYGTYRLPAEAPVCSALEPTP